MFYLVRLIMVAIYVSAVGYSTSVRGRACACQ
jgi:hypothetical protein